MTDSSKQVGVDTLTVWLRDMGTELLQFDEGDIIGGYEDGYIAGVTMSSAYLLNKLVEAGLVDASAVRITFNGIPVDMSKENQE